MNFRIRIFIGSSSSCTPYLLFQDKHDKIVSPHAPERAHMTLSWHGKTAAKHVAPYWRRFYGGFFRIFSDFSYVIDNQRDIRKPISCLYVSFVKNRATKPPKQSILEPQTVCLASPTSQSCILTLTILHSKTLKMTSRKTADDTANRIFRTWKHDFLTFGRVQESVSRTTWMIGFLRVRWLYQYYM